MYYEYTAEGQVNKETKVIDGVTYVTQYTYDQNGNVKTMTYSSGGVIIYNYSNDRAVGVLNNAANLAANINYKPFGGVSSLTYGNGIAGSISYDNQYRITGITAGAVMNLSYPTYDANGNIMAINNALDPTKNKSFTYDALDRLSTATASGIWGSLGWTYDGVGNRMTENGNAYTYFMGGNRLNTANGLSYSFDSNGNTIGEGSKIYTYNQNQRLVMAVNGSTIANYTYNSYGQRVKKVVNGVMTIFHYNRAGLLIAEADNMGTITAEYIYISIMPLAKVEGTNVYYYHNDHLGTPQKMTDSPGAVVWAADYKPFGEATVTVSTITNNLRFPGQYFNSETDLHYNYYRDYNPVIGRYVEADPLNIGSMQIKPRKARNIRESYIAEPRRHHLYIYVGHNPLIRKDPLGLDDLSDLEPDGTLVWFNWCGPGGSGPTKGCLDEACKKHDGCYEDCGLDASTRWLPSNIYKKCALICDKDLAKDWKDCACKK